MHGDSAGVRDHLVLAVHEGRPKIYQNIYHKCYIDCRKDKSN